MESLKAGLTSGLKAFIVAALGQIVVLLESGAPLTWRALAAPVIAAGLKAFWKYLEVTWGGEIDGNDGADA